MNKVYKLVWSKTKNMYVAVCEYARIRTKSPTAGGLNRAVVAGVLASVLSCGAVMPVMAAGDATNVSETNTNAVTGADVYAYLESLNLTDAIKSRKSSFATGWSVADGAYSVSIGRAKVYRDYISSGDFPTQAALGSTSDVDYGIGIGFEAQVATTNGVAIGHNSTAGFHQCDNSSALAPVGIGYSANAYGSGAIAIGYDTTAGMNSPSKEPDSDLGTIAIGIHARARDRGSIVIGSNAKTIRGIGAVSIGEQSIAADDYGVSFGKNTYAMGSNTTSIGYRAITFSPYSVALGSESSASGSVVSVGHKVGDSYTDNAGATSFSKYTSDLFRRVINVADGTDDHDAVTYGQLKPTINSLSFENGKLNYTKVNGNNGSIDLPVKSYSGGNGIQVNNDGEISTKNVLMYDSDANDAVSLVGTGGTKLTNLKQGTLSDTSTDAVTGAQLYAVRQDIAGFAADINRNKESIRDMNSSISTALESVSSASELVDSINGLKADASLNNLTAAGQQVITNAAVNAVQEYMASQSATNSTNAVPPAAPKLMVSGGMRLMSINPAPADTNYVVYDDASGSVVTLEGQPGTRTKITNLADGELSAASTDAVTGSQLYAVTQEFDDFQSALSKNNTSIARAQTDINNIKTTNLGLQSDVNTLNTQMEAGMNVTIDGALVKNVNPESNYVNFVTGDNITLFNDNGSLKISAKSDGAVTNGNTGLVSGGTVYNAIQDALAGYGGEAGTALAGKANADASNIGKNADTDNSSAWGQALGTGTVSANDDKLVTGNTVYNETRVASDSNYLKKDVSAAANLQNLDTAVKTNADAIAAHSDMLSAHDDAIQQLQDGATSTASDIAGLKDLSNLTDAGKEVIRSFAKDSVDVTSADSSVSVTKTFDTNRTVFDLSVVKDGRVEEGNTGILTGDTVYKAIKDINPYGDNVITGVDSGAIGKRNNVAGNGSYVVGNDNTVAEGSDDIFVLGSNVTATGKNSVVLGTGSDGSQDNVVSVGSDGHERKIVHVADGSVTQNSKDAVNGGQLYDVREDLRHANGIDVDDWSRKLAVGSVAEGDTGLVNGGTVYNALQQFTGSDAVTVDWESGVLRVGGSSKYDDISVVDFSTSQGDSRVLTGIATNPNDPTSAANVGYVNAIGQNIVNGVNDGFAKIDDKFRKAGASAAAMASLEAPPMDGDEKWAFSAAVGHYDGKTAGAVGAFFRPQDNLIVNVRGAAGNGEEMIGAGIGISLNRGNTPGVSKAQLVRTVNAQAGEIQQLKGTVHDITQSYQARFEAMNNQIAELTETIQQLKAKTNG